MRSSSVEVSECRYPIVQEAVRQLGWVIADSTKEADVIWSDMSCGPDRLLKLQPHQRINHFPGILELARKKGLARTISRLRRAFPALYNFHPRVWQLPEQRSQLLSELAACCARDRPRTFILKPDAGCQGRGIRLVQRVEELELLEREGDDPRTGTKASSPTKKAPPLSAVASLYVERPLLWQGRKFDLRLYVLVRSCRPLDVLLYREGLVRLCAESYAAPSPDNLGDQFRHLTNYAVNRNHALARRQEERDIRRRQRAAGGGEGSAGSRSEEDERSWCRGVVWDDGPVCFKGRVLGLVHECDEFFGERDPCSTGQDSSISTLPLLSLEDGAGLLAQQVLHPHRTKRLLSELWEVMERRGLDHRLLWSRIRRLVALTLLAAEPLLHPRYGAAPQRADGRNQKEGGEGRGAESPSKRPSLFPAVHRHPADRASHLPPPCPCFELLGLDVLIDQELRPWLLEVNHSPSFTTDLEVDVAVKLPLLQDALRMIGPGGGAEEGGFERVLPSGHPEEQALYASVEEASAKLYLSHTAQGRLQRTMALLEQEIVLKAQQAAREQQEILARGQRRKRRRQALLEVRRRALENAAAGRREQEAEQRMSQAIEEPGRWEEGDVRLDEVECKASPLPTEDAWFERWTRRESGVQCFERCCQGACCVDEPTATARGAAEIDSSSHAMIPHSPSSIPPVHLTAAVVFFSGARPCPLDEPILESLPTPEQSADQLLRAGTSEASIQGSCSVDAPTASMHSSRSLSGSADNECSLHCEDVQPRWLDTMTVPHAEAKTSSTPLLTPSQLTTRLAVQQPFHRTLCRSRASSRLAAGERSGPSPLPWGVMPKAPPILGQASLSLDGIGITPELRK